VKQQKLAIRRHVRWKDIIRRETDETPLVSEYELVTAGPGRQTTVDPIGFTGWSGRRSPIAGDHLAMN
jgi:hypothetical protein